jgi:(p)ppGpp synthase/HD superfamily hydrolase
MMNSELVIRARDFAEEKHKGQTRKDGSPYVNHPIRVADIIFEFKESKNIDELLAAALLHDTLEDTDTGISELRDNFWEAVTLLVVELTSDKLRSNIVGKVNYLSDRFSDERAIGNWGLVIKLADRLDNVSDLEDTDIEFARRIKHQTLIFLDALEEKRELTQTHKGLILAIRKKLEELKI